MSSTAAQYDDNEDIDMDEDMDMAGYEDESGPLFWSMTIEPGKGQDIPQPAIESYIVHITNACFGEKVNKNSRSVVVVSYEEEEDDDTPKEAPIAVLTQGHRENVQLDLLFNESATISVKGQKPSPVYLTGYLQPPVRSPEEDEMNPMYEDLDDEQIQAIMKEQRRQQRMYDDEEGDEDEEEPQLIDEDDISPPNKKQKTGATTSKSTKNGNTPKDTKKRKESKKSSQSDDKKEDKESTSKDTQPQKQQKKKDKKKDKKMQNMKGGIKYRDMKVGSGDVVKNGDKLRVFYVGQLDDKKVFDKCISGQGFEFNYGKGDVIKGWDMGLKGMRVGGKRKLIIPSKLGYGTQGSPPSIPPNSQLTFTIEVKGVN